MKAWANAARNRLKDGIDGFFIEGPLINGVCHEMKKEFHSGPLLALEMKISRGFGRVYEKVHNLKKHRQNLFTVLYLKQIAFYHFTTQI